MEALDIYDSETRYRGAEYFKCKSIIAYSRFKQGQAASVVAELKDYLEKFEELLYVPSIHISTILVQLAEACTADGDTDTARDCLMRAIPMRKQVLPEHSPRIREAEEMLAQLPAAKAATV